MAKATKPAEAEKDNRSPGYYVKVSFRDRDNFAKEYPVGLDVSNFEKDRLAHLVDTGIVEHVEQATAADPE